jgi:tRNA(Ile)-lysidine synthase
LNSNFTKRIGVTIENLKKTDSLFDFLFDHYSQKFITSNEDLLYVDKNILNEISDKESFLFFILSKYGFNSTQVSNIFNAFYKTGTIFKNDVFELLIDRDHIVIRNAKILDNREYDIKMGKNLIGDNLLLELKTIKNNSDLKFDDDYKYLNSNNLTFPLKLRKWKAGDRFKPFGLRGKSKKIKDYFIDKKLSRFEKDDVFLLLNNNDVCMILGMEIAYDYRVKQTTESLIRINVIS